MILLIANFIMHMWTQILLIDVITYIIFKCTTTTMYKNMQKHQIQRDAIERLSFLGGGCNINWSPVALNLACGGTTTPSNVVIIGSWSDIFPCCSHAISFPSSLPLPPKVWPQHTNGISPSNFHIRKYRTKKTNGTGSIVDRTSNPATNKHQTGYGSACGFACNQML